MRYEYSSTHVVVFVLWSTKYTRAVFVSRISQPLGRGPSCDTGCCWIVVPPVLAPYIRMYCCRRGSTQVVVRVLWSTKYGRPSGVNRCSQPGGSSPVPAVVAPVAIMDTAFAVAAAALLLAPLGGVFAWRSDRFGELAPVRSSGRVRFWCARRSICMFASRCDRCALSL